jgi:HAE1 family hydrophobic/amphiphilic exporter-1
MMCSRVLSARDPNHRTVVERFAHWLEAKCLGWYGPTLTYALRHWYYSVLAYALCGAGVIYFAMIVPKTFLPIGDSGFISGVFIAPPSASPALMRAYQLQVDKVIRSNPYVENFVSVTGIPQYINSNFGIVFVSLVDEKQRPPIDAVNGMLMAGMAQIPGLVPSIRAQPVLQISTGATSKQTGNYAYVLYGLDKQQVYQSAFMLMGGMMQSGYFSGVVPDLFPNNPQLNLRLNRPIASQYGVTATNFGQLLSNAYAQNYSYLIKSDYQQYWTIVEAQPKYRSKPTNLDWLYFNSLLNQSTLYNTNSSFDVQNKLVPFRAVADSTPTTGPVAVNHFNGFSSVTLSFDTAPGVPIGAATHVVEAIAKAVHVPDSIMRGFQGDALTFQQTFVSMVLMAGVAVFVMYLILGILYESYIHPITVLLSLPVAIVGGLGTLLVFHSEASLYALIGGFMLMGIVKKNAIMMIDFAIMRQAEGRTPLDAVHEACLERFRPIIMTTLAAFFGAIPLASGWGADAASRIPLGLTICGGLAVSQLITLYVTPVTYLGFDWVQTRVLDRIPFFARGELAPASAKS